MIVHQRVGITDKGTFLTGLAKLIKKCLPVIITIIDWFLPVSPCSNMINCIHRKVLRVLPWSKIIAKISKMSNVET